MATPAQSRLSHTVDPRAPRLLWPREHGAYGQLLFPLATALFIGRRPLAAFALALAFCAAFMGHEAVLVLLGQRGPRARRDRRHDALASLALCCVVAVAAGTWSAAHVSAPMRTWLLLPVAAALVLIPFIWLRTEHSTSGEIVAAIGLASCAVPVALAGGVPLARALTGWLVFAVTFAVATVTVRSVIAGVRPHSGPSPTAALAFAGVVIVGSMLAAVSGATTWTVPAALVPVCGLSVGLAVTVPHPRHLRTLGWGLVSATAITAILLAVLP